MRLRPVRFVAAWLLASTLFLLAIDATDGSIELWSSARAQGGTIPVGTPFVVITDRSGPGAFLQMGGGSPPPPRIGRRVCGRSRRRSCQSWSVIGVRSSVLPSPRIRRES